MSERIRGDFQACTSPSPLCPVQATTYGYYPVLWANATLLAVFALIAVAQIVLAIWKKNRAFSSVVAIATAMEAGGYAGRILMHQNPWNQNGFKVQIVLIILAPSFLAAAFYLSVKHVVLYLGPEHSRLKPSLYTWIFCTCDAVSIILQALGGGLAAAADSGNTMLLNTGNGFIVGGIAFQVATQFICACLTADFIIRVHRHARRSSVVESPLRNRSQGFWYFIVSASIAFLFIFVRCVYRLPEMAGGWGGPLMRKETEFLILDGL